MINAGLSKYDIQVLKGLIGNQFIRFRSQEIDNWGKVYGNLEIISNDKRIEIQNEQKPIMFFNGIEDVATFNVIEKKTDEKFEPMVLDVPIIDYEIKDQIVNISIINDHIEIFNNTDELIYAISMDMGIVFHMINQILVVSKGWYFDESINIIRDKDYLEKIRTIEQVKRDWLDPEIDDGYVKCFRNEVFIK